MRIGIDVGGTKLLGVLVVTDAHRDDITVHDVGQLRRPFRHDEFAQRHDAVQPTSVIQNVDVVNCLALGSLHA